MRYLLDTNILVHLVREDRDKISYDIWNIIDDFSNRMYASSISIIELFQLYRIGKIKNPFQNPRSNDYLFRNSILCRYSAFWENTSGGVGRVKYSY